MQIVVTYTSIDEQACWLGLCTEGKIQATQHEDEVSIAGTKPETPHKADTPVAAVPKSIVAVRPRVEARGHTGYLTFARLAVAL